MVSLSLLCVILSSLTTKPRDMQGGRICGGLLHGLLKDISYCLISAIKFVPQHLLCVDNLYILFEGI